VESFDWSGLSDVFIRIIPALLCITLHELSHGFTAYLLGDNTAKNAGRLSLNPIKHMDFMGVIMILTVGFGWAKPVPVDMRNFKNPKRGMAITALAGPFCNILIAVVFLLIYGLFAIKLIATDFGAIVLRLLGSTAYISCAFAVFNMLPIPPLDGSKVLFSVMKEEHYDKLMRYERYGSIILIALIVTGVISQPLSTLINGVFNFLYPVAELGIRLSAGATI